MRSHSLLLHPKIIESVVTSQNRSYLNRVPLGLDKMFADSVKLMYSRRSAFKSDCLDFQSYYLVGISSVLVSKNAWSS